MKKLSLLFILALTVLSSILSLRGSRLFADPTDYVPQHSMLTTEVKALFAGPLTEIKAYVSEDLYIAESAHDLALYEKRQSQSINKILKTQAGRVLKIDGESHGYQYARVYVAFEDKCNSIDCALVFRMNSFALRDLGPERKYRFDLFSCEGADSIDSKPCYNQFLMESPKVPEGEDTWIYRKLNFFVKRSQSFDIWGKNSNTVVNQQIFADKSFLHPIYASSVNPTCLVLRNYELVSQTPISWCFKDAISLRLTK